MEIINSELDIFLTKGSIKESVVKKNLPNLYEYLLDKDGNTISEKVFLLLNKRGICKICSSDVKFISIKRGYRTYCSRKCSNNDDELSKQKVENAKKTNLMIYGVDNPSKSDIVKKKIIDSKSIIDYKKVNKKFKKTMIEKYGVDNPSKVNNFKKKKKITSKYNWGVDNPFQSDEIKVKIKEKLLNNYGVDHPLKSKEILNSIKERNIERWGVDNYTKTKDYKELMFEKYRSGSIKTNLTINTNYVSYKGLGSHELKCDNGFDHTYITNSHLYHARNKNKNKQCLVCYPLNEISSFKEIEIYEFIKSIYDGEVIKSYRNGLEIDIYLPEYNIGFEFNGLYWHSELFKEKDYHLNKSDYFKNKGIRIIHLWEDDWDFKKEILKSQIKNWLGITENKIWARKCEVRNIEIVDEYRDFLNENHIQGYVSSSIKIGLFYNNELVSLMTFDHFEGRKKMGENEWNLSRFCNKINYNIIGGASKLLIYFIKNFNPSRIISFADRSWSDGNLYNNLGFSLVNISSPNYSYLIDKKRSNKQKWKKSNLVKMGFDKNLSESKIMEDNFGSYKIYDCGQIKFELLI